MIDEVEGSASAKTIVRSPRLAVVGSRPPAAQLQPLAAMRRRSTLAVATTLLVAASLIPSVTAVPARASENTSDSAYIPKNLDDALNELEVVLGNDGRAKVIRSSEDDMILYHMSLGLWMRNTWGLWRGSKLCKYFNSLGIFHPDDMSQIILTSYWRRVHNRSIDLDEQIRSHQEYWRRQKAQR